MNTITTFQDKLAVNFPYDIDIINRLRDIDGARWDKINRVWTVKPTIGNIPSILALQKIGFSLSVEAEKSISYITGQAKETTENSKAIDSDIEVTGLGGELLPFQRAGVAYVSKIKRCFIGDEPGLGKTIMALATIQNLKTFPAIVICPASVKYNWEREAQKWLPGRSTMVLNGKDDGISKTDIVIINYNILGRWLPVLQAIKAKAIIIDESQMIKSAKALRSKMTMTLAKMIDVRLCLTGTPVLNRPQELIHQLKVLGRLEEMGGFWHFAQHFCGAYQSRFGLDMSGATNLVELNEKLRATCYIRRKKADVLPELPDKRRTNVYVEIDNRREYNKAKADIVSWFKQNALNDEHFLATLEDKTDEEIRIAKRQYSEEAEKKAQRAEQLVKIEVLKKLTVDGKMVAIEEWIDDFLESDEKLIVFAHHRNVVERIATKFKAVRIIGGDDALDRQKAVDKFQTDPKCRLIVCSLQAGGIGITLTASSNVVFLELGWTPAVHEQSEDRAHRIGQKESVNIWYLLGKDTIDEEISSLIEEKRQVVNAATDGIEEEKAQSGIMKALIDKMIK